MFWQYGDLADGRGVRNLVLDVKPDAINKLVANSYIRAPLAYPNID